MPVVYLYTGSILIIFEPYVDEIGVLAYAAALLLERYTVIITIIKHLYCVREKASSIRRGSPVVVARKKEKRFVESQIREPSRKLGRLKIARVGRE